MQFSPKSKLTSFVDPRWFRLWLFSLCFFGLIAVPSVNAQVVHSGAVEVTPSQEVAEVESTPQRPANWAQPIQADGAPNLFRVSDTLYRSAQPTAQGMCSLKSMGMKTIVNLRSLHSDRDEIGDSGLGYVRISMTTWNPEEKDLVRFLATVTKPGRTPVLVHCRRGSDRTGLACATYRVVVQGWSKEDAIDEMANGGYGFDPVWSNIVRKVRELDVASLRRQAGLDPLPLR